MRVHGIAASIKYETEANYGLRLTIASLWPQNRENRAEDSPSVLRHDGTYAYLDDAEGELPSLLPGRDFSLFV